MSDWCGCAHMFAATARAVAVAAAVVAAAATAAAVAAAVARCNRFTCASHRYCGAPREGGGRTTYDVFSTVSNRLRPMSPTEMGRVRSTLESLDEGDGESAASVDSYEFSSCDESQLVRDAEFVEGACMLGDGATAASSSSRLPPPLAPQPVGSQRRTPLREVIDHSRALKQTRVASVAGGVLVTGRSPIVSRAARASGGRKRSAAMSTSMTKRADKRTDMRNTPTVGSRARSRVKPPVLPAVRNQQQGQRRGEQAATAMALDNSKIDALHEEARSTEGSRHDATAAKLASAGDAQFILASKLLQGGDFTDDREAARARAVAEEQRLRADSSWHKQRASVAHSAPTPSVPPAAASPVPSAVHVQQQFEIDAVANANAPFYAGARRQARRPDAQQEPAHPQVRRVGWWVRVDRLGFCCVYVYRIAPAAMRTDADAVRPRCREAAWPQRWG